MSTFSAGTLECFHAGNRAQMLATHKQQELRFAVNGFPPVSPLALGRTVGSLHTILVRRHRPRGLSAGTVPVRRACVACLGRVGRRDHGVVVLGQSFLFRIATVVPVCGWALFGKRNATGQGQEYGT